MSINFDDELKKYNDKIIQQNTTKETETNVSSSVKEYNAQNYNKPTTSTIPNPDATDERSGTDYEDLDYSNTIKDTNLNTGIYQPVGSGNLLKAAGDMSLRALSGGMLRSSSTFDNNTIDINNMDKRTENSITNDGIRFFMFDNVPYLIGKTANAFGAFASTLTNELGRANKNNGSSNPNLILGAKKFIDSALNEAKYFTTNEITNQLLITHSTLFVGDSLFGSQFKGISIKSQLGNLKGKQPIEFNGSVDFDSNDDPFKFKIDNEDDNKKTYSAAATKKKIMDFKGNVGNTGYIYIYPLKKDNIRNFKIPFQFTPTITESGQTAKYESTSLLHRTGSISSYVNTEGESLSLETSYLMLSEDDEDEYVSESDERRMLSNFIKNLSPPTKKEKTINGPTHTWYDAWTPKTIQQIERVYRSLVLPFTGENITSFSKPPVVKIVFDKSLKNSNEVYSMLKYPIGNKGKFYHRTYVVTEVQITKDLKETPLYINDDGTIKDTHGFKVNLELMEIDYNYIGVLPEFGSYYNSYKAGLEAKGLINEK